jgi:hypothetical protein
VSNYFEVIISFKALHSTGEYGRACSRIFKILNERLYSNGKKSTASRELLFAPPERIAMMSRH